MTADPGVSPTPPRTRHVAVNLSGHRRAESAYPGVLIDWRRARSGWEAQVAYVTPDGTLHVTWCLAEQLRPIEE